MIQDVYSRITLKAGPIDVLVINAGTNHKGLPFTDLSEDECTAILETNLIGPVTLVHGCITLLSFTAEFLYKGWAHLITCPLQPCSPQCS
mmetsp:Transcript_34217/g.55359  ORF Transcript_34217/g.55359 Transcript_34217/m.55359 type:complete len:90 (-) Transcript_34217:3094-3363(-)